MADSLGFLSVRQHAEHGYFGGFLILNAMARPLEFHCTLPIKPSRAQVLLYGATLNDFVCGEQIGQALLKKSKQPPDLILTDCPPVLALNHVSDVTTLLLREDSARQPTTSLTTPPSATPTRKVRVGDQDFESPLDLDCSTEVITTILDGLASHFELQEPFQRIVEALMEAHPIVRAA